MTDDETKAARDALIFGTGYMLDGKHVPMEDVMTDDLVKRLREFDTKKMDAWAICDDAADRIEQLERLLEQRDSFIVKNDLWHDFVATLKEKKDAD
jgi:hypothetical protein